MSIQSPLLSLHSATSARARRRQTSLALDTLAMPAMTETTPHATTFDLEKNLESAPTTDVPPATPSSPDCPLPQPSIRLLFSLVPRRDFYLIVLPAILTSVLAGGVAPFMTFVVGQSFNSFANFPTSPNPSQSAKSSLLHGVGLAALELVGLAAGALALSSITSSLWIWTGERNLRAVRKKVYAAVTQKDMVWFDTKMGAEDSVQVVEGDGPLGAGGLMAKFARCVDWPLRLLHCLTYPAERLTRFGWHRPSHPASSSST